MADIKVMKTRNGSVEELSGHTPTVTSASAPFITENGKTDCRLVRRRITI